MVVKDRCASARAKRPFVVVLGGVRPGLQAGLNAFSEGILEGIQLWSSKRLSCWIFQVPRGET